MKFTPCALFALATLALIAAVPTRSAAAPSHNTGARRAAAQPDIQAIQSDVQVLRSAVQAHDRSAAMTAITKLKADWKALSPAARQRIVANHPAVKSMLLGIKTLHTDMAAIKAARQKGDKAAVQSAVAKLRSDWATLPPALKEIVQTVRPEIAKALG
jgi:soluble cytochrome b562